MDLKKVQFGNGDGTCSSHKIIELSDRASVKVGCGLDSGHPLPHAARQTVSDVVVTFRWPAKNG